jgi:hypothetical protein
MLISPYHKQSHLICQSRDVTKNAEIIIYPILAVNGKYPNTQFSCTFHSNLLNGFGQIFLTIILQFGQTLASLSKYKPTKKSWHWGSQRGTAKLRRFVPLPKKKLDPSNPLLPSSIFLPPVINVLPSK